MYAEPIPKRILCALFGALVVAIAEGGLYLIYANRSKPSATTTSAKRAKKLVKGPIVSLEIPKQDILQAEEDLPSVEATVIPDAVQDGSDAGVRKRVTRRPDIGRQSGPS